MFNQKKDNEADFCESYKSQVLGTEEDEEESSLFSTIVKLLIILILLAIITGVSFYGYNYFINNQNFKNTVLPPASMQSLEEETISDEDLVVKLEEPKIEKVTLKEVADNEQITHAEVVVDVEEPKIEKAIKEKNISLPLVVSPQVEEIDMETIANDVKIAIAKSEIKEENETKAAAEIVEELNSILETNITEEINITNKEESLEVPTSAPEAQYLEELADLSKEIDKERNK